MEIHFEIENRCLLKCRHCSSYASISGKSMKYSQEDMIAFLSQIKGRKEVFLTGGEPLLYPCVEQLLYNLYTQISDIDIGMFTTGLIEKGEDINAISEEYAKVLYENGLKVCYLSVYSHSAEEHDWMTKQEGAFEMVKKSIINLKAAGVEVRFNSVVTLRNKDCLFELIKVAEAWGVAEIRFLKLIRHGRACESWEEIGISEKQYREAISNVMNHENKIRITASGAVDMLPCRYAYDVGVCPAGKYLLYITFEGDIYPCASTKNCVQYKIGSIKEKDINEKCGEFGENTNGALLCKM